ncbi:AI-2E family transporter [Lentiprolixibacter aurantiacus]|uniref:AI-2E family transporter n=1 Tax=Lentiprolixibacter aurantiacus TaxID=2993939 RepID=A0AAE3SPN9_9FLAO|nr:AI-2E family transporter [Lentiprolixibacter aurantiacus]MCX2720780.1 AI-2E family transporter [Lentiprolixibacter aurantiacus]
MSNAGISLKNIFYFLGISTLAVWITITAKVVLIPLLFSVLLALFLNPIVNFFERHIRNNILAILVSYITAVIPFLLVLGFFFNQSRILFGNLPSSRDKLKEKMTLAMDWVDHKFKLDAESTSHWVEKNFNSIVDVPADALGESLTSTTTVIAHVVLIIVLTYFILLYRISFKNFLLAQVGPDQRKKLEALFLKVQYLTKRYLMGQAIVIVILGLLIGTGLWAIGVPYAYFWGFLAGFLEIIPYIGTTIGVVLPFTYMLILSDTLWQPIAVVALYIMIQQIEGNLISPNIMGPSIKINPLFIILGLFIGAIVWGIPGMILALPVLAITKEILRGFDRTVPLSYIMENGLSRKSGIFLDKYDLGKYRLIKPLMKKEED